MKRSLPVWGVFLLLGAILWQMVQVANNTAYASASRQKPASGGYIDVNRPGRLDQNAGDSGMNTSPIFLPVAENGQDPASGGGATFSFTPSDDGQVKSKYPTKSYGSQSDLRLLQGSSETIYSYLKITVTGLSSQIIQKATLKVYAYDGSNVGGSIYSVSNNYKGTSTSWLESGLTWDNAPTMGGSPLATVGNVNNNSWVVFDVTAAVNGNGTVSFGLKNTSTNSIYFDSTEATQNKPVLIVETRGSAPTPPLPTATPPPPTATPPPPTATPGPGPTPTPTPPPPPSGGSSGMWLSAAEIASLPMSGTAWDNVHDAAQENTTSPNISDQNDDTDVYALAKALVYVRTGDNSYREEVIDAIMDAIGTETGSGILAVGRNMQAYVIAADLINLSDNPVEDSTFRAWIAALRHVVFSGAGPVLSVIGCHEERPNNFGTHCGASRIAIALYLDDTAELAAAANVFHGWLGNRSAYTGFNFGDLDWQCDPDNSVGINPAGCTIDGHSVDGVLPDDQRRSGDFTWPPPKENYVWEALQGALVQAQLLHRAGYPAWTWENQALLRAVSWLHDEADYPAESDDEWEPWLVNYAYNATFPTVQSADPGKGMGWTDWTAGQMP